MTHARFALLPLSVLLLLTACREIRQDQLLSTPSAQQLDFMDREIGAFFHFTTNTFTGAEHGDGSAQPSDFNPSALDVESWMEAAENIGAKYAVLTVRHEDGFCLWPTATTPYCVRNSPWKNGQGDLVREFVDACRRHAIKPGFYFSPNYNGAEIFTAKDRPVAWGRVWDSVTLLRNTDTAFVARLQRLEVAQITELLRNYGPIYYIWMDHWSDRGNCRAVTETIRRLQPDCLCCGPDVRTPGNEKGTSVYPLWNAVYTKDSTNHTRAAERVDELEVSPNTYGLLETSRIKGHPQGLFWRNEECPTADLFNHGGWFWHGELLPLSMEERIENYYRSVGLGANLMINLPPDTCGKIPQETLAATRAWGDTIRSLFAGPYLAERAQLPAGDTVELSWQLPQPIDHVMLMEDLTQGQRVAAYELEVRVAGNWQKALPANRFATVPDGYNATPLFETVGHKKIDRIEPVVADGLRFRCTERVAAPVRLRSIAVWSTAR